MRTLLESLTYRVIGPAIKKKWFSKPSVPFRRYLGAYEEAFEMGVAIGFAYRDRLPWLAQLFSDQGREHELVNALRDLVKKRLSESQDATSLFDLGMFAEEARVKAEISERSTQSMLTQALSQPLSDDEIWEMPKQKKFDTDAIAEKLEIPIATAFGNLQTVMSVGIGLGGAFPEKAEQFWKHQYEEPVTEYRILKLRAAGLKLPATMPNSLSLEQYGEQMRSVVNAFVSENRPNLATQFASAAR